MVSSQMMKLIPLSRCVIHVPMNSWRLLKNPGLATARNFSKASHLALPFSPRTLQPPTVLLEVGKISSGLRYNSTNKLGNKVKLLHVHGGNFSNVYVRSLFSTKDCFKDNNEKINFPQNDGGRLSFFSLKSLISTPFPFMAYGLGGLIPFASAPLYMYFTGYYDPNIAYYQLVYGATIVSFLGGVSWGESLPHSKNASLQSLCYSITLPLISWVCVLVHPNPLSSLILISTVGFAGYVDTQNKTYPQWFKNLRFFLSSAVLMCLISSFVIRLTKPSAPLVEKKAL